MPLRHQADVQLARAFALIGYGEVRVSCVKTGGGKQADRTAEQAKDLRRRAPDGCRARHDFGRSPVFFAQLLDGGLVDTHGCTERTAQQMQLVLNDKCRWATS